MSVRRFPGYAYSRSQHAGVVAARNHLALTNPTGSGKVIVVGGVFLGQVTAGGVALVDPMRGWSATAVSGGTLEAVSAIFKVRSTLPDPVGQIRINGVTATLGAPWFNSPALLTTGAASAPFIHQIPTSIPGSDAVTLLPGESTVLRTETGDTDQRWNITIGWVEVG